MSGTCGHTHPRGIRRWAFSSQLRAPRISRPPLGFLALFSVPYSFVLLFLPGRFVLHDRTQLGVVQLSLEFNGVERNFSVSPLHATLIMHFEGKNEVMCCGDLATYVVMVL